AETEIGDGLPDIRYTKQCLAALKTRPSYIMEMSRMATLY
ncbi:hypothetical protein Tco_0759892, partial [Tanacetum coccineum]